MKSPTKLATVMALVSLLLSALPAAAAGGTVIFVPIAAGGITSTIPTSIRTVNAPYLNTPEPFEEMAIFWYGKVTSNDAYSDVRISYDDNNIQLNVATIDRLLWYSTNPNPGALTNWDTVSVYFQTDGKTANTPNDKSYRIDVGFGPDGQFSQYRAVYRGSGSDWIAINADVKTSTAYRGDNPPNSGSDGRGWVARFNIPFSSLGVQKPANGDLWRLGLSTFNRFGQSPADIKVATWPEQVKAKAPATWGNLRFGMPAYTARASSLGGVTLVRNRLNNATVIDANVGGYTQCGGNSSTFWSQWGERVWSSYNPEKSDFNVQNQADIADWPCFAKYYTIFPLNQVPAGKVIRSATLTIFQFGGSQPQDAKPSLLQVLTVDRDFDPATINWNNAPLPLENVGRSWVDVILNKANLPDAPRVFDVSYAVSQAYTSNQPLRLALYSASGDYHSGKYFVSSGTGDWNALSRPILTIEWGNP